MIELLVVISILALLIGLLLPALARTRFTARLTTCGSNLHQIGVAAHAYAAEHRDVLPLGPPAPDGLFYGGDTQATNQIYSLPTTRHVALGLLLPGDYLADPRAVFCPGDDTADPVEELEHIRSLSDNAFSSYMYRQRDGWSDRELTLARPAVNDAGAPAVVLAFDLNFLTPAFGPDLLRSNHQHRVVNALYLDGHVRALPNSVDGSTDGPYTVPSSTTFATLSGDLDALLVRLDAAAGP